MLDKIVGIIEDIGTGKTIIQVDKALKVCLGVKALSVYAANRIGQLSSVNAEHKDDARQAEQMLDSLKQNNGILRPTSIQLIHEDDHWVVISNIRENTCKIFLKLIDSRHGCFVCLEAIGNDSSREFSQHSPYPFIYTLKVNNPIGCYFGKSWQCSLSNLASKTDSLVPLEAGHSFGFRGQLIVYFSKKYVQRVIRKISLPSTEIDRST